MHIETLVKVLVMIEWTLKSVELETPLDVIAKFENGMLEGFSATNYISFLKYKVFVIHGSHLTSNFLIIT